MGKREGEGREGEGGGEGGGRGGEGGGGGRNFRNLAWVMERRTGGEYVQRVENWSRCLKSLFTVYVL